MAEQVGGRGRLHRLPILVLLAAGVLTAVAFERTASDGPVQGAGQEAVVVQAEAPPAEAGASSWLCPGGPTGNGAPELVVANSTDFEVPGLLTVYGDDGAVTSVPFAVGAEARIELHPADVLEAVSVAALVELGGGGVAVEQVTSGSDLTATPCATAAAGEWFFAYGTTQRGAQHDLVVFNPFPDDAVIDVRFPTEDGVREPEAFRGVIVPGRTLVVLDVDAVVTRRELVAAHATARTGRVVMARRIERERVDGVGGTDLRVGLQAAAGEWFFPGGPEPDPDGGGIDDTYRIFNPGAGEAVVDIELLVSGPDGACTGEVEPIGVTVPGGEVVSVQVHGPERVPEGCASAGIVRTLDDVPVVVERVRLGRAGLDAAPGSRLTATTWLLPAGSTDGAEEYVSVLNPGPVPTTVSVRTLLGARSAPIPGLEDVEVPAAGVLRLRMSEFVRQQALALVVEAASAVVVERIILPPVPAGSPGLSTIIGIPIRPE